METIQQGLKRTELAFEAGMPQDSKRKKIIVVTIGVLVLCGWALLALYSIAGGNSDLNFAPEIVYVPQAPAPAAGGSTSFYQPARRSVAPMAYKSVGSYHPSAVSYSPAPKAAMSSTSYRVHQTSSATVHSYGGGGTGGGNTGAIIRHNNAGSGVNYAALSYSGAIYVPTRHSAVTAVGANEASDFSAQKMSVIRRAKAENGEGEWPDTPEDPAPDPEQPEPIGDIPFALILLLATAYALRIAQRRKAEQVVK